MDAIAIKEASTAIKTLATQLATEGARCPAHAKIVEITNQIAFQADCILNWFVLPDPTDTLEKRVAKLESDAHRNDNGPAPCTISN